MTHFDNIYPVPLREGETAQLYLPSDLTVSETEKICRVVMALANPSQPPHQEKDKGTMTQAITDISAERDRQINAEGWTPEHDDEHRDKELGFAASCYADPTFADGGDENAFFPTDWPWDGDWWKPKSYRENLVRAGALILAEIERIDRKDKG